MDNVLVTGGAGFIGSNLAEELLRRNYGVIVVDDLSTGNMENLDPSIFLYNWDIREFDSLEKLFKIHRPKYVFHLAAQISVPDSVRDPKKDADINIIGTLNLLILSKKYGVEKFIFSSSGGVMYGETPPVFPTPEDVPADPISPYGISKYSAERYIIFFHREHGLRYTILRYSNVYGPKQNPYGEAGVVAIFTTRMLKDQDVEIYGDGENIRDYVFVGDVVNANILAMEKADGEILNIGTGKGTTVNELFEMLKKMTGYNREAKHVAPRPGDLRKNVLDWSSAKEKLGWSPKYKLEDGLKLTVEWFRENLP